jgi:soluble lytic murein transglycosylase
MSASNARGLMQLLPATAARVAAQLGEPEPGELALFEPAVNIRYGAWYLAALVEGFGSEALALAGYNGGPYNIKSLILTRPGLPLDIFLESLIFEETTRYVKRITESRYIYEMAYLGQAVLPDLTGPIQPPGDSLPDF